MRDGEYGRRDSALHLVFYGPAACVIGYVLSSSRCSPRSPSFRRAPRRRSRPRRSRPSWRARCATRAASRAPTCATSTASAPLFAAKADAPAGARLGGEALHDRLRADALRARRHAGRRRSPGAGSWTPTGSGAATSTCAAAAIPRSARDDLRRLSRAVAAAGILRVDGSRARRRVALRPAARLLRHRRRLRPRHRRRAQRAGPQPRLLQGRTAGRPGRAPVREGPARRRHPRRGAPAAPAPRRPARRSWPRSPRRRCATSSA